MPKQSLAADGYKMLQQHSTQWLLQAVLSFSPSISVARVSLSQLSRHSLANKIFRQCPGSNMVLSSLCHSRIPTDLRGLPLVLGLPINSPDHQRHSLCQTSYLRASVDCDNHADRRLSLGHWHCFTHGPSRLLSSSTRPDPEFLQISDAPQDSALVLRYCTHSELLPIRTIRT